MTQPVLFDTLTTKGPARIGVATLNAPQVLNGLSMEMVDLLAAQLHAWAHDASIAMVVLRAAGDKAFCAGGDLHGLYASAQAAGRGAPWANEGARRFFEHEYRLDYQIHHYPKPVLCWGHGIVMGGGMGLMMGASHRVVTERSRLAMPEITIGLFPDVGGSWLLSRMQGRLGLFLALTAANLEAADAMYAGWADFMIMQDQYDAVIHALQEAPWEVRVQEHSDRHVQGSTDAPGNEPVDAPARGLNDALLTRILQTHSATPAGDGPLARHTYLINSVCAGTDLQAIGDGIVQLQDHEDPWLAKAASTYSRGAPGSARVAFAFQDRARLMSLADVLRMEYIGVLAALAYGDVQEGIRALLIDKDKSPKWQPATLAQADAAWLAQFFEPPWPEGHAHPLATLEADYAKG